MLEIKQMIRIISIRHLIGLSRSTFKTNKRSKHDISRRALMYVPGHDEKKIQKIKSLNADCVVLDLEDGVGYDK